MLLAGLPVVQAQAPDVADQQQQTGPAPQQTWTADQLDDLVAPIALYPDQLLSQVLVASTYPLEVVEAQQWMQRNSGLQGQQRLDAARQQNWDASVQALVAFPDVLARLNQDVRWTTELGNAFLAQQADVMSAVQRMRSRAQANGKLQTTPQQTVTTETENGQSAIQIQPADPQTVYVPYYDPSYIWGPPAYGYYPGLYYPSYGWGFWPGINVGFYFGGWGGWGLGWGGWGWGPNWFGHGVFVNYGFFNHFGFRGGFYGRPGFAGRTAWAHDPGHRLGVGYPTRGLTSRFGAASVASRANYAGSRSFTTNRGSFQGSRGSTGFAGSRYQSGGNTGAGRNFQSGQAGRNYGGQSYRTSPQAGGMNRGFANSPSRSYSAPQSRSFSAPRSRSFGAPQSRSYSAPQSRSFSAPQSRSFSAPRSSGGGFSAPRSFSGGGGGHSFGGGGGHSFGGGGGHSGGGGGHSGGHR
ncbi:MAG TPA: DUF3300 domain-containing protein [Bryobacteraceae bacterium]|nr:DUF3300 domain-containing protein [Bryobacteraceae bacterium]